MEWVRGAVGAEPVGQEQTEREAGPQCARLGCHNETMHNSNLMNNNSTHSRFQETPAAFGGGKYAGRAIDEVGPR